MTRNAFGTYLVPPSALTLAERVGLLEELVHDLGTGRVSPYTADWLRCAVAAKLKYGGTLDEHLGLRPVQGSHATPERIVRMRRRDSLLVQLSTAAGSDANALRVLAGAAPCPHRARELLDELQGQGHYTPRSPAVFTAARRRLSRLGP